VVGAVTPVLATLALSACGVSATPTTTAHTGAGAQRTPVAAATTHRTRPRRHMQHASHAVPRRRRSVARPHRSSGLAYSVASAQVVQRQPAAGSCHAVGTGLYSRPDPRCTPGALNPAVRQSTIAATICSSGWTSTVRPSESVTEPEKFASMTAYGDTGPPSAYEYDHFIPLELGGAVNDPRNLWPEPGASPNPKDAIEDELNHRVCDGQMTLAEAQRAIAANWEALASRAPRTPAATGGMARCTVRAAYNGRYHDYDVYVHSNQPDQTVTVTDSAGRSASWHTDSAGYADVYFRTGEAASGQRITARVGGASCSGTL
jgi:hypothetical protein